MIAEQDDQRAPRNRRLGLGPGVRLIALGAAVGLAALALVTSGTVSVHRVAQWFEGSGALGPLAFVAVSAVLTVGLFPGPLLAGASGALFGTALGTAVSIVSATLGALAAFTVARVVAGDAIPALGGARLRAASEWVGRRGFVSVLYARITPGVPYTLVNYAAGLSPVGVGAFVSATALGVAPRAFAYTALGGSLRHLDAPEAIIAVSVLVVMAVAGAALAWRARSRS
ncbi:MAG TPA: VTT domain-containing protein [Solirubrobacteraceae bacterium]|nr:VTT domain-containing protein [Solirubrobacteraceae bacterium]